MNTYSYVVNNPVNLIDPKGKEVVLFLACEAANLGWGTGSAIANNTLLTESTEMIRDQLKRVNEEISNCPIDDLKRYEKLDEIRNDLVEQLADVLSENTPMSSLADAGPAMMRAGVCALLLALPAP